MNKFWTIFKREYLLRVKSRSFIVWTTFVPIIIIFLSSGAAQFLKLKTEKIKKIGIVNFSNIAFDDLIKQINHKNRSYEFNIISAKVEELHSIKNRLNGQLEQNQLDSYFIVPPEIAETSELFVYSMNLNNFDEMRLLQKALSLILINYRLKDHKLNSSLFEKLTQSVSFRMYKVLRDGTEKEERGTSYLITFILVLLLYLSLVMYGAFVMRSVYEEKLSRVIEIVISSCTPLQLMTGKVIGIGAVGLTQLTIWLAISSMLSFFLGRLVYNFPLPESPFTVVPVSTLIYFIAFFILGYFLFASLYAALGAMANSDHDAQQLQFPAIMIIIVAFILACYTIKYPLSTLSKIASFIPFFSPITMFTRIVLQTPPAGEIILSIVILMLSVMLLIWLSAKIFRVGILMYGKRPKLTELINWISGV